MYLDNVDLKSAVIVFPGNRGIGTAINAAVNSRKNTKKIGVALTFLPRVLFFIHLLPLNILNLNM